MRPVFGYTKPWKRTKDTEKFKKNYKQFAKTQIIEAIKIISYYLNNTSFYFSFFILIQLNLYCKKTLILARFGNHWDLLLRDCAKGREKETNTPLT